MATPLVDPPVRPVPTSAAGRAEPAWGRTPTQPTISPVPQAPSWSGRSIHESTVDSDESPAAPAEDWTDSIDSILKSTLDGLAQPPPDPVFEREEEDRLISPPYEGGEMWGCSADSFVRGEEEQPSLSPPYEGGARGGSSGDPDEPPQGGLDVPPQPSEESEAPHPITPEANVPVPAASAVEPRRLSSSDENQSHPVRDDRVRGARPIAPSWEQVEESSRLTGREPKKRRPVRDRVGPERRGKVPRGSRPADRASASDSRRDTPTPTADEVIWPSVRDILPNHGTNLGPRPTVTRERKSRQPLPTVPREPGQWLLPVWLAWPPVAVSVLVMGLGACVLSWIWAVNASSSAIVTQRLLWPDTSPRRKGLPDSVVPPDGRWMTTTSQHVAHWAVFLGGREGDANRPGADVSEMLTRSLQISPLNPTARLALSRLEPASGGRSARPSGSLGLSRDAVSLAWSARRLLDAGKKDAAIRLYGRALSAASTGGYSRSVTPRYSEDENASRFLLPGEDAVRDIVSEMDAQDWTFREWSRALPQNPTVLLATARLLREKRRAEAEPLLARLVEGQVTSTTGDGIDPRAVAARAEALALASRLKEAEQVYRQAIELADNDMIRRSWWFNLADIAQRLDDETQRLVAIRAAIAVVPSDEITRRGLAPARGRPATEEELWIGELSPEFVRESDPRSRIPDCESTSPRWMALIIHSQFAIRHLELF